MICINNDLLIENKADLNMYIDALNQQISDEEAEVVAEIIANYLIDIWDRLEKVNIMLEKYVTDKIFPMCYVDIYDTADLTKIMIEPFTSDPDYRPKEKDLMAFKQFCNKYFASFTNLYDILCTVDL